MSHTLKIIKCSLIKVSPYLLPDLNLLRKGIIHENYYRGLKSKSNIFSGYYYLTYLDDQFINDSYKLQKEYYWSINSMRIAVAHGAVNVRYKW